jgi:hypothetical protein
MAKGPDFTSGLSGYGPWPDNDKLESEQDPSPHYPEGFYNRSPAGTSREAPSDMWLSAMVYPERTRAITTREADAMDIRSRKYEVTLSNLMGTKTGPAE